MPRFISFCFAHIEEIPFGRKLWQAVFPFQPKNMAFFSSGQKEAMMQLIIIPALLLFLLSLKFFFH